MRSADNEVVEQVLRPFIHAGGSSKAEYRAPIVHATFVGRAVDIAIFIYCEISRWLKAVECVEIVDRRELPHARLLLQHKNRSGVFRATKAGRANHRAVRA